MKNICKALIFALVLILTLAFVSCDEDDKNGDKAEAPVGDINGGADKNSEEVKDSEETKESDKPVEIAEGITKAMTFANSLSGSNYFLASDGSILIMGDDEFDGLATAYSQMTGVEKIVRGTSALFALTDSGELYYADKVIGSGIEALSYCTTNSNVEGFCLSGKDIMWITSDEKLYEYKRNSDFKDMVTRESISGKPVTIEVDKHDFFVVTEEGKLFALVSSIDQYEGLDFTGFENLVLVDEAKHMGGGEVESLTIAGLKRDGSVVAIGTYADEILSWGKLSDLAMSDGMIVALTEDGKVKMTGDFADKMKETVEGWTNITAIETGYANGNNIGYLITAVSSDGVFYYVSMTDERSSIDTGSATSDAGSTGDRMWFKYSADGQEYYSDNGAWELN